MRGSIESCTTKKEILSGEFLNSAGVRLYDCRSFGLDFGLGERESARINGRYHDTTVRAKGSTVGNIPFLTFSFPRYPFDDLLPAGWVSLYLKQDKKQRELEGLIFVNDSSGFAECRLA